MQEHIVMDPLAYNEVRTRPSLEERLESIISGAALMADSSCTRDERRERIVAECNAVRQALQDLLSEYMSNVSSAHLYISSYHISCLYCCLYLWRQVLRNNVLCIYWFYYKVLHWTE